MQQTAQLFNRLSPPSKFDFVFRVPRGPRITLAGTPPWPQWPVQATHNFNTRATAHVLYAQAYAQDRARASATAAYPFSASPTIGGGTR